MSIDTKRLSEHSQVKALTTNKHALERKVLKIQEDNRALEKRLAEEKHLLEKQIIESKEIKTEIRNLDLIDVPDDKKYFSIYKYPNSIILIVKEIISEFWKIFKI